MSTLCSSLVAVVSFTLQHPTIVCHHALIPQTLIPLLDHSDILMESLPVHIASSTEVIREKAQMLMEEV